MAATVAILEYFKQHLLNISQIIKMYIETYWEASGPKIIKLIPCSTQLSTKFILLINVQMPTIVGILTLISMINTTSEKLLYLSVF